MSAEELLKTYRRKKLSPLEVTRALLDRVEKINPQINAIVTLNAEEALKKARAAERAFSKGGKDKRYEAGL